MHFSYSHYFSQVVLIYQNSGAISGYKSNLWYPQFFPPKRMKLTILSKQDAQGSEFVRSFGEFEDPKSPFEII